MYIQCKVYIQICRKWRAYNRTIVVQDLPQDIIEKQKKAILEARKPGKEETVWISSDSEAEINEVNYFPDQVKAGWLLHLNIFYLLMIANLLELQCSTYY